MAKKRGIISRIYTTLSGVFAGVSCSGGACLAGDGPVCALCMEVEAAKVSRVFGKRGRKRSKGLVARVDPNGQLHGAGRRRHIVKLFFDFSSSAC